MPSRRQNRAIRPNQSNAPSPSAPGAEFAYEAAREQLAQALDRINRADTKAGILVGVLIAATGGFFAVHLNPLARTLVVTPLILACLLTAGSLLMTRVKSGPHPRSVAEVVDLTPQEIRSALIPIVIDAYEVTSAQAVRKERLLKLAFAVTVVGAVAALIAKAVRG